MSGTRPTPTRRAADDFAQARLLRSHIERCLQDIWETQELVTDLEGDFPFRWQTAACWVAPVFIPHPAVQVLAHAALGVKRTAKLLVELNELNAKSRMCQIYWLNGLIYVYATLPNGSFDRDALELAMHDVAATAADIGPMIAAVHGGTTPFPVEIDEISHDNGEVA